MSEPFLKYKWGDILEVYKSKLQMSDDEDYPLASIRRRNGGFFHRETKKGADILTKTLSETRPKSFVISRMQVVHGACAYANEDFAGTFLSASYTQFIPQSPERIDTKFLHYLGHLDEMYKSFLRSSHGVHIEKMTFDLKDWMRQEVKLPPLPEQKKIASILTSVDEVIENTQKQIDKLQDLKKATMNELLTKGIGHTEFKDSELGRIPKSWEVKRFGDLGRWRGGGTPSKSNSQFWQGKIPWISPKDMKDEFISDSEDHISENAISDSSCNLINSNSILVVVRSGILKHTLPVAISTTTLAVNQDMKALTVGNQTTPLFVFHYLKSNNQKILRSVLKAGNTVESVDFSVFSDYPIPLPHIDEQLKITNIVEEISKKLRNKTLYQHKIKALKKSLMQDLLTGKKRVQLN